VLGWKHHIKSTFYQLRRYRHIMAVLMKYGFEDVAEALRAKFKIRLGERAVPMYVERAAKEHTRPVRLRMALEELGPTFIKLGQLLSTRPDLIPAEYISELEKLQDQAPPEKTELIIAEIEKELGGKIDTLFASFDPQPLAAGSIAQVHHATTHDGKDVVLKVRRPDIVKIIQAETKMLEDIAVLLKVAFFEKNTIDPQQMVREFIAAVSQEVDLSIERRNQLRFYHNFKDDPAIHVPEVHEQYCSRGVLTMEYIDGIKCTDTEAIKQADLDPKIIAKRGAEFILKQIFEMGFFHTDPHPGNFFLLPGNVLAPLDFGQVAHLSIRDRELLNDIVLAVVDNDVARMVKGLDRFGIISLQTDVERLTVDLEELFVTYYAMPLRDIPVGKIIMQTFDIIRRHHVRPPSQFTLMLKSLMTIESFANSLDPQFQIIDSLTPYARKFSLREFDPKQILRNTQKVMRDTADLITRFPEDVNAILNKFRQGLLLVRIQHEHLESLSRSFDRSASRISFALIVAALLVASGMLVPQQGIVLGLVSLQTLGILGYIIAAIVGAWLIISIIRSRHL
jgi:ubiquinone biosynthesis protein